MPRGLPVSAAAREFPSPRASRRVYTLTVKMLEAKFTRADYDVLPEGFPAQLIAGRLVKEPSPTYGHQRTVGRIHMELFRIVGSNRVVESPIDVYVDDENVLQPDLLVLAEAPEPDARHVAIPILVVEVLSPATADRDRREKREIFLRAGVREVWIVDPESETIEIHTGEEVRVRGPDETAESEVVPGLAITPRSVLR